MIFSPPVVLGATALALVSFLVKAYFTKCRISRHGKPLRSVSFHFAHHDTMTT